MSQVRLQMYLYVHAHIHAHGERIAYVCFCVCIITLQFSSECREAVSDDVNTWVVKTNYLSFLIA